MNTDKDIECLQNDSQSNRSKPKFLYQHVLPEQLLFHHNLKAVFKKTHIIYFLSLSPSLSVPASFLLVHGSSPRGLDSCLGSFTTASLQWRVQDQTDLLAREVKA